LLETALSEAIDAFKPDFVYSYGWWKDTADIGAYIGVIKSKGLCHVWWSADDPTCFAISSLPAAKKSDLVFTPAEELIPVYAKYGIAAYLQPNACSPHFIKLPPRDAYRYDIVLAADNYSMRYVDAETRKSIHYTFRVDGVRQL
jgi:hypothetical protein